MLLLFLTSMNVLQPVLLTGITVFAEEESSETAESESGDDVEEVKDVISNNQNANAYSFGNAIAVDGFDSAASYDPALHYLVTYSILDSAYNDGKNQSSYSSIYRGNHNGAFDGVVGQAVKKAKGEIKTDAVGYVQGLMKSEKEKEDGGDLDGDGTQAAGEGEDTTVSEEEKAENELSSEQRAQLELDLTTKVTDELYNAINGNLTLKLDKVDTLNGLTYGLYAQSWNGSIWGGRTAFVRTTGVESFGVLSETAASKYRTYLSTAVKEFIGNGGLVGGAISETDIDTILKRTHEVLLSSNKSLINKKEGLNFYGIGSLPLLEVNVKAVVEGANISLKSEQIDLDGYNILNGYNIYVAIEKDNYYKDNPQGYNDLLQMPVYEIYKKVKNSEWKSFTDAMVGANDNIKASDLYKQYQKVVTDNKVQTDGYKLLSWTSLVPQLLAGADVTELVDGLEAFDKTSVVGGALTKGGKERTLVAGDIFMTTKKFSPLLVGKDTGETEPTSKLFVGSTTTGFSTGEEPINKYLSPRRKGFDWFQGDATQFPGDGTDISGAVSDWNKEDGDFTASQYILKTATADPEGWGGTFVASHAGHTTAEVGLDAYGNIINALNGSVILPYWQNGMFEELKPTQYEGNMFMSSPMFTTKTQGDMLKGLFDLSLADYDTKESNTPQRMESIVGSSWANNAELVAVVDKVRGGFPAKFNVDTYYNNLTNGVEGLSREETLRAVALIISAYTEKDVKTFNKKFVQAAKTSQRMYLLTGNEDIKGATGNSDGEEFRWTAASLIQKIGHLMDYGLYDLVKLTVSKAVAVFYNNTIQNAGMTEIFYTPNIMQTVGDSWIIILIASVLALILTIYTLYMAFRMWRGTATLKQLVVQFFMLTFVLVIPTMIYGPLTDLILNYPTQEILNNQLKTTAILDTYIAKDEAETQVNEIYLNMFDRSEEDLMGQLFTSYNLRFYTTTDKAGFDIDNVSENDPNLTTAQRLRVKQYQVEGIDYPTRHLVSVDVPLVDLYKWVWDIRNRGDSSEFASRYDGFPTYEQAMAEGYTKPLFQWLANGGSEFQKVVGYQKELATYREYRVDLVKPLLLKDADFKETWDMLYGDNPGGLQPGVIVDQTEAEALQSYRLTASELFYNIVKNSSEGQVPYNLSRLSALSDMVNFTTVAPESTNYIPTGSDIQSLVRDLSLTKVRRTEYYGDDGYAPFTRAVMDVENPYVLKNVAGEELTLAVNPALKIPEQDFLDLYGIIGQLTPNRTSDYISPYYKSKNKTIHGDVYDINKTLLMNYLTTYSITRASLGDSRNQEGLAHAEQMVMVTEAFFQFNDVLNLRHFPTMYYAGGITFDKYLTLVYVPFKDYMMPTLNFYNDISVIPRSTAEAIVLRSSPLALLLFLVALILLIVFGFLYLAIFHGIFLVIICYSYIKNYVIKQNYDNKSWLGTLMIYGGFGLGKIGLVTLWWWMSSSFNGSIARHPELKMPYEPVLVHSIYIIAYLLLLFFAVILPIGKAVIKDPDNLGGQVFSDTLGRMKGRFGGLSQGIIRGGTSKTGGSARNAMRNEGRRGKPHQSNNFMPSKDLRHLQASASRMNVPLSTLGPQAQASAVRAVESKVAQTGGKLNKNKNTYKAQVGVPDTLVTMGKGTTTNKAESAVMFANLARMNTIDATVGGIADKALLAAEAGTVLATFGESAISTFELGTAKSARVVAQGLVRKGVNAKSLGSQVYMDSTEYDLTDKGVRAELFRSSVQDLQDTYQSQAVEFSDEKIRFQKNKPELFRVGSDGKVSLFFGEEGLDGVNYDKLFNSKEFKGNFIQPTITDSMIDAQGNMTGWVDIYPNNPRIATDVLTSQVEELYNRDTRIRKKTKSNPRSESSYTHKFALSNLTEEDKRYVEQVAGQHNLMVQGDAVYYKNTKGQKKGIEELTTYFGQKNSELRDDYIDTSKNLTSYIVKNGVNQGIKNNTTAASEQVEGTDLIYGTQPLRKNISKVKVNHEQQTDILRTYDTLNKVHSLSSKNKQSVLAYQETKEQVNTLAYNSLLKTGERGLVDSTVYANEVESFLDRSVLKSSKAYKEIRQARHELNTQRDNQKISEADYHAKNLEYTESYKELLADAGMLDEFSLGVVKTKDSRLHADYFDKRKQVATKAQTDEVELSRLRSKDLTTTSKLVQDKKALTVQDGVATISYSQDDANSKIGVDGPGGDTESFILRTNLDRSYLNSKKTGKSNLFSKRDKDTVKVPDQDFVVSEANKPLFNTYKQKIEGAQSVNEVLEISRQLREEEQGRTMEQLKKGKDRNVDQDDTFRILTELAQEKRRRYSFNHGDDTPTRPFKTTEQGSSTTQPKPKSTGSFNTRVVTEDDINQLYANIQNATSIKELLELESIIKGHVSQLSHNNTEQAKKEKSALTKLVMDISKKKRNLN